MWASTVRYIPETKEQYDGYWQAVREIVPRERLMEWDMKKHTFEDICSFLGIDPCPRSGKIPRARNNFIFQRDFPFNTICVLPYVLATHWLNWKLLGLLFTLLG